MKLLKLIILLLSITTFSQVTQTVKGTVIDSQSEYPLDAANVLIQINDKDYGAITNFDGEYEVKNVPIGKINISAHYKGFSSRNFTQIDLVSGKELVVNFTLLEKLEGLDEIVIKAKGKR